MVMRKIRARAISKGVAEGELIISKEPISFLGGVDSKSGVVVEKGHPLEGKSTVGRILLFPHGKGSTVGSYALLELKRNGKAPAAIININAEPIVVVGAIISGIPMVDMPEKNVLKTLSDGMKIRVDGTAGTIAILD